jgi:hypothetical protein
MFPTNLFSSDELKKLRQLNTPSKVQDYLDSLSFNFEEKQETCMSARRVLKENKAHCIEGAMLACTAFMLAGRKPLILNIKVSKDDDDHIVALFKENGFWGAVSKTNHAVLRYRDPVYRTVRELAMSYFHEYFLVSNGKKTMLGYSRVIHLKRFGFSWLAEERDLWDIAEHIYDSYHFPAVPAKNKNLLRKASRLEQRAASLEQAKS